MATTPLDPEPGEAIQPAANEPGDGARTASDSSTERTETRTETRSKERGETRRASDPGEKRRSAGAPLPVAAVVASLWAAVISYGSVLAVTALAVARSSTGFDETARFAVGGWLLAHGVPLSIAGQRVSLVPLAVAGLAAWRLTRAGVHTSRAIGGHRGRSVRPAVLGAIVTGLAYGGIAAIVAALARDGAAPFEPLRAFVTLGGFGIVFAVLGAVRGAQAGRALGRRIPLIVRDGVRSGFVATVLIVAAGSGTGGVALALHGGTAADLFSSYGTGFLGQAGITALCLVYLPNLAVWGATYLLGPGFAVGADTLISPGEVLVGPVPAIPVLAGLPSGPLTGVGPLLLIIPLAAGLCTGLLLMRRRRTEWRDLIGAAVLAGPVAGVLLQFAAFAAAGALGSGRLTGIGAVTWWVGGLCAIVVSVGSVVAAIWIRLATPTRQSS